jgi:glycosyltransferase involved in cell wall biosynthesis
MAETDTKITFIIPTIGRPTLKETLSSLINQTYDKWYAIVIFDDIDPDETILAEFTDRSVFSDPRIEIIRSPKLGEGTNSAGNVRNYGIKYAKTEWIAFVDDDDSVKHSYVECFLDEIINHDVDTIIFRMVSEGHTILPPIDTDNFYCCGVGISFALKKSIFDAGIVFEPSCTEDFFLLDKIRENKYKIMISPHVLYYVRNYNNHIESHDCGSRVFI